MREGFVAAGLIALAACGLSSAPPAPVTRPASPGAQAAEPEKPADEFTDRVRPILEARCRPCHFEGGVMHARLPFDQEMTIRMLGTKLFTRLKDENEQAVLRAFLEGPGRAP